MRLVLVACAALAACGPAEPLPVLGDVGAFTLTDESAKSFDSASLTGRIWVADFVYTTCPGPCPRMSRLMKEAQSITRARLITFTVDPERDTPAVLAEYARRYGADPARWTFLTGPREDLHRLSFDAFKLSSVDGSLNHSSRLVLIDGKARIRGYYSTEEDSPVARLARDIQQLEKEAQP